MFRKFWNNVLQTNQEYPASYVSNCKPRCLKRCTTTFTPEHSLSLPWVVGNSGVVPPTQQCTPTCPHTAFSIKELLSVHQITVLLHEPNSPDLSPCDFLLFPWLKQALKGQHYADILAILTAMTKSCAAFQKVLSRTFFKDLQKCWKQCVDAERSTGM